MLRDILGGNPAHAVPPTQPNPEEQLPARLREHVQRLRLIRTVISVSTLALRAQNAELDEDIASVLRSSAVDPLDVEIEQIEALIESLAFARRAREVRG